MLIARGQRGGAGRAARLGVAAAGLALVTGCAALPPSSNPTTSGAARSIAPVSQALDTTDPGALVAAAQTQAAESAVPRFEHIVVVVLSGPPYDRLAGSKAAPFLDSLLTSGAALTESYSVARESQPNYLALFAGSTLGVTTDACPQRLSGPTLASALTAGGYTFAGYAEGQPASDPSVCTSGGYVRRHVPWSDFAAVPRGDSRALTSFPRDFRQLPTVAIVIPDLAHDMADGSVAQGDHWLAAHLGGYASWAPSHDSLLVVTTDGGSDNHIVTVFAGAHVGSTPSHRHVDHYTVLATILASLDLPGVGRAADAPPIVDIWRR